MQIRRHTKKSLLLAATALSFVPISVSTVIAQNDTTVADTEAGKIQFSADNLSYDQETSNIIATGNVRLEKDGFILEAQEVRYNEKTGVAEAIGAVKLSTPNGDILYAPHMMVDNALKDALIEDLRLILADGAQVRAAKGVRDDASGVMSLDRIVYSPCKVCADGSGKKPLWQIRAVKVVHDKEKHRLIYDDAVLEVFGVPVFWTPYFSHPDPTVDKASGLLPLNIQTTKNLGFYVGLPYYWVIDDSKDLTVTPVFTTKEGFVLQSEYRQHLRSGKYSLGGSVTYTDERDTLNMLTGDHEFRGHVESEGQFGHGPKWRSTYQLNWASDDTYLRRYDISDADTLTSEYKLEGFLGQSYFSARTMAFQGLRKEDIAGLTAFALPLIDAEYVPNYKPFGGTLNFRGNALALHRTAGLDTQRVSLSASWERRWITPKGFIVDANAFARSDAYNLNDADKPDTEAFAGTFGSSGGSDWRNLARLTTSISWPLVKYSGSGTQTLEPIVEITVSPRKGTPDNIVNEDSRAFELNALNLFSADRTSGFDLWEEGSRMTYGMRWRYEGTDLTTDILIGQTWRITGEDVVLADGIGLEGDISNLVGRTTVTYKNWLDVEHRYRLNEKTFAALRNEIDVTLGDDTRFIRIGYLKLNRDLDIINREDREEIRASAFYKINREWNLNGTFTRRLKGAVIDGVDEGNGNIEYSFGVGYQNECIELGLKLRRTYTEDRDIEPGTSILFRLKLMNLG
ncbi:LPS-assembly protein LptD [Kordiimonas pumila]|uniref:LPS-assembly protein LptD n=1 Tax=Kordiimonas pumila TaxID=2161677 RepID=A0ABV7D1V4_9PROT|nr:LPS assembly protein LptD [Kordiimonas pumila]